MENFFKSASPTPGSSDELEITTSAPAYIHPVSDGSNAAKSKRNWRNAKSTTQTQSKKETKKESTKQPRKQCVHHEQ